VAADCDPPAGGGAEGEEGLRIAVDGDQPFGRDGARGGGTAVAPTSGEPELGRGIRETFGRPRRALTVTGGGRLVADGWSQPDATGTQAGLANTRMKNGRMSST
jgi:hypothetical protein